MCSESIREKTKVPDSDEAFWQHMEEEAAQELGSQQRHLAQLAAVSVVLPPEGDALAIERQQTVIGDGEARKPSYWFGIPVGTNRYVVTLISDIDPRRIRMNYLQPGLPIADDGQVLSSLFDSLVRLFRFASFLS
jgi:hypothetical protein